MWPCVGPGPGDEVEQSPHTKTTPGCTTVHSLNLTSCHAGTEPASLEGV